MIDDPAARGELRAVIEAAERAGDDLVAGRALAMELAVLVGQGALDRNSYARLADRARAKATRTADPLARAMLDCIETHVDDPKTVATCLRFEL